MTRSSSCGFGLIELLITVAVIAILLSTGQPLLTGLLEARRVSGAAELIRTQLLYARTEAIQQMVPMVVSYSMNDAVDWKMGMRDEIGCNPALSDPDLPDACSIPDSGGRSLTVLDGSEFQAIAASANRSTTRFDPIHGTTLGTNVTITLRSPSGKEIKVIVSNIGRVRSCSPSGNARVAGYPIC